MVPASFDVVVVFVYRLDLDSEDVTMLGAIAGDMIGSVHEWTATKTKQFPLFIEASYFTDDTVLTIAVADTLLHGGSYVVSFHKYYIAYPNPMGGYGPKYEQWAWEKKREPYNSWGNGSAMRVSPVAYVHDTLDEVLAEAKRSAEVTHNHPEGIKGAQATAAAIFLARTGSTKEQIRELIESKFGYNLADTLDQIRPTYDFDVSCQGSVPQSIIAFLESTSFEDTIRNAISLGGDADTLACIAGGIAEPYYGGVPDDIAAEVLARLNTPVRTIVDEFTAKYGHKVPRKS